MIDLDALKAAGLNSAEHSARLLAEHHKRQRDALHTELWAKYLRDNPDASEADLRAFAKRIDTRASA